MPSDLVGQYADDDLYGMFSQTYAVTLTFIHAMALFPDVQQKIQAEIDSVVGSHRLPNISDRANLPYVCAAIKEALRWNPITPLSVPRRISKDDYYNGMFSSRDTNIADVNWPGYFIPADTIVLPNVW